MAMKIVLFESGDVDEEYLRSELSEHELVFVSAPLTEENVHEAEGAGVVSVFVDSRVDGNVVVRLADFGCGLIATRSTGFDHIDVQVARERNLAVANVPHYGENTVAEHTMALILCLARKLYQTIDRTERGNYSLEGLRGFDLKDKVLGVYGLGRIGSYVVKMAHGFGMRILAYARTPDEELAAQYGVEYVDGIEALLSQSDVLTFHCPLTDETHHLVNKNNIGRAKRGMVIVNTARGPLIETEALIWALDEGIVVGAGLDVLEEEAAMKEEKNMFMSEFRSKTDLVTLMANHILVGRDDVVFTAHNAFNSYEAVRRILDTTVENIKAHISGSPVNLVS